MTADMRIRVRRCYHCRRPFEPRGPAQLCLDCEATRPEREAQRRREADAKREATRRAWRDAVKVGDRYGRWTVTSATYVRPGEAWRRVNAVCDCGTVGAPRVSNLRSGQSRGCNGCRLAGPARRRTEVLIDQRTPYADDDRCWYVVEMHPDGLTLDQVGLLMGVTRERVRQIEERAKRKLALACQLAGVTREDFEAMMAMRARG